MKKISIALPLLLLGLLTACQSGEDASSEAQSAAERAQARWDHVIAGELEEAYAFYSPGYRQTTSPEEFSLSMRQRAVRWEEAQVRASDCEGPRCKVTVEVSYRVPNAPAGLSNAKGLREVSETWIRMDGQWWYTAPE